MRFPTLLKLVLKSVKDMIESQSAFPCSATQPQARTTSQTTQTNRTLSLLQTWSPLLLPGLEVIRTIGMVLEWGVVHGDLCVVFSSNDAEHRRSDFVVNDSLVIFSYNVDAEFLIRYGP